MTDADLRELLDSEAARINNPDFIDADPVQFPRRFTRLQDIEISAILCASIAWGNRKMICRDCDRMLALMDNSPYDYVMDRGFDDLPDMNIHRTFFASNMRHFLRGFHRVYSRYDSIADFARAREVAADEFPAWRLVEYLNEELAEANGGVCDSRCMPLGLDTTALKRINMALRWLVRDDGIVDMGVWRGVMHPRQLYIPLDVHVAATARELGLLDRRSNDRRAVAELTSRLRLYRPEDPVIYDYALFGIGMNL